MYLTYARTRVSSGTQAQTQTQTDTPGVESIDGLIRSSKKRISHRYQLYKGFRV
jgi:hypothetical protein